MGPNVYPDPSCRKLTPSSTEMKKTNDKDNDDEGRRPKCIGLCEQRQAQPDLNMWWFRLKLFLLFL
jgi:hypothetical protein